MKGSAEADIAERQKNLEKHKQELAHGRLPDGPYEFEENLKFKQKSTAATATQRRFEKAIMRDAAYSTGSPVYLVLRGMSKGLRHIYDGGGEIQNGIRGEEFE